MSITEQFAPVIKQYVTPELVQKYLGDAKALLGVADLALRLVPSESAAKVLAAVRTGIAAVEPYLDEPAVYQVVNEVIAVFNHGGVPAALASLAAVIKTTL